MKRVGGYFGIRFQDEDGVGILTCPSSEGVSPPIPDMDEIVTLSPVFSSQEGTRYRVLSREFSYEFSAAGDWWYTATITVEKEKSAMDLEYVLAQVMKNHLDESPWVDMSYTPSKKKLAAVGAY